MKNLPVYKHPASYAREHDELAAYRASNQANAACKEAIEAAIRDHYRDNRLDTAAVDQVVQQFGYDRALAMTARSMSLPLPSVKRIGTDGIHPTTGHGQTPCPSPPIPTHGVLTATAIWPSTAIPVWWICFSARPAKPTHRSGRKPLSGIS